MNDLNESQKAAQEEFKPILATCREIELTAALRWIRMGWETYRKAPRCGLIYGILVMIVSYVVFGTAWYIGSVTVAIAMLSAFIFIGPVMCLGLYSIARQLKRYPRANLKKSFRHGFRPYGDLAIFIIVLTVIALLWARAASMIHVFFPVGAKHELRDMAIFFGIGTTVGSVFSMLVFSVSVFSLPMILDKKVDMITCCVSSFNAVLRNKRAMALWAFIIVLLTGLSFVTAFLGFMVVIPVLGFATWHSYRESLIVDDWEDRIAEFSDNGAIPTES